MVALSQISYPYGNFKRGKKKKKTQNFHSDSDTWKKA